MYQQITEKLQELKTKVDGYDDELTMAINLIQTIQALNTGVIDENNYAAFILLNENVVLKQLLKKYYSSQEIENELDDYQILATG